MRVRGVLDPNSRCGPRGCDRVILPAMKRLMVFGFLWATVASALAQVPPNTPPEIAAILKKGAKATPAELQKVKEFYLKQAKGAPADRDAAEDAVAKKKDELLKGAGG